VSDQAVETQDLVREYKGGVKAVDGVSLSIASGGIFGFLGPNGAGKSTTVRMLTTLLKPTSGTAIVAGYDVAKHPDQVRRRIGVALQDAAIDPYMTGRELLRLQGVLHALPRAECRARAESLLERVDLVTGGASAVYGADAVAGVVNFVTRRNFSGVEARTMYSISGEGDAARRNNDLTLGANLADGLGNVAVHIGTTRTDALRLAERGYANTVISSMI
jgi:ABC-type glutathione transport system ATPase component